jgi:hypothetical protein
MLQAGPKTSASVVTPVSAAADVAGADAGALPVVAVVVDGLAELQAANATVSAAIAPTAASRRIFRTVPPFDGAVRRR